MVNVELELEGFRNLIDALNDLEARLDSDTTWLVGTAVNYSVFLELGTSDMDPKPFFRPALGELRAKGVGGFIRDNTNTTLEALDETDEVVAAVAFGLERRIKEIITRKDLIDTGTLRASVLAVPNGVLGDLPGADEFSGFDSDSPAPANAGRALVESADTEVDI
jgi:hypothetical protein